MSRVLRASAEELYARDLAYTPPERRSSATPRRYGETDEVI
jgi:hypothetical protein